MMSLICNCLFAAMWAGYFVYWHVMSTGVKAAERIEPAESRITRMVLMLCSIALLALPRVPPPFLNDRFLPQFGESYETYSRHVSALVPHIL